MSVFGDDTAKQDMLDWLRMVKSDHNMNWLDFLEALAEVFAYLASDAKFELEEKN